MRVIGIDVETTGLLASEDRIIEVGAVLYDWNTGIPLEMLSKLVIPEREIPVEITKITGITGEMVAQHGTVELGVIQELVMMMCQADYAMAHNAAFDRGFIETACSRHDIGGESQWLCTKEDIKYPESITTRNLRHLAAEHGFLNPFSHRAVFDVLTMFKIAEQYSLADMVKRSKEPTLYVQAVVSFDDKEKAKARGYYWCGPKKIWWRTFKESDYAAEKDACGFKTVLLAGSPE